MVLVMYVHFVHQRTLRLRQISMNSALYLEQVLDHIFNMIWCSHRLATRDTTFDLALRGLPSTLFGSLTGAMGWPSSDRATCGTGSCCEAEVAIERFGCGQLSGEC